MANRGSIYLRLRRRPDNEYEEEREDDVSSAELEDTRLHDAPGDQRLNDAVIDWRLRDITGDERLRVAPVDERLQDARRDGRLQNDPRDRRQQDIPGGRRLQDPPGDRRLQDAPGAGLTAEMAMLGPTSSHSLPAVMAAVIHAEGRDRASVSDIMPPLANVIPSQGLRPPFVRGVDVIHIPQNIDPRPAHLSLAADAELRQEMNEGSAPPRPDPLSIAASNSAPPRPDPLSIAASNSKLPLPSVTHPKSSMMGFQYLQQRQYGQVKVHMDKLYEDQVSCQLPKVLMEREFQLGSMNKIFASKWLNDKQAVFGTKCNQVVVMDVRTEQMTLIPTLQSSKESVAAEQPCGIHGISVNPSGTMLATGASNTNDIGIYRLPTFDPLCIGEGAHTDWVFDLEWIDDEFLVTGSRDNNMALWRIDNVDESQTSRMSCLYVPEYAVKKPLVVKQCNRAQKVRALSVNQWKKEMAVLSLNAYLHLWDIETFDQQWSSRLTCSRENVCMTVSEEKNLYAVGSYSYVTLVDSRKKVCQPIPAKQRERGLCQGIRSLSFCKDIITIGTGMGVILFFDVRAMKYLDNMCGHPCQLAVGPGWLREDENYRDIFFGHSYPNAIYTHSYDHSGVRLFTAGGPLPAGLWGNYAALWA